MKENWINSLLFAFLLVAMACTKRTAENHTTYTCPMHPTVVADAPGRCPVCGMDLVPTTRHPEETNIPREVAQLLKSGNDGVIASVKTIRPQFKSVALTVNATGTVTYDPRRLYTIPARVGGRIEKAYLKYEYQDVRKGQKVADIYSPELITAQRELLYLLENDPDNKALINASEKRLMLLGMQEFQIEALKQRRSITNTFSVYSPYDGIVATTPTQASSTDDGMGGRQSGRPAEALVREGDYVTAGQTLYHIANIAALRISLEVPAAWSTIIREGDSIKLDTGDGANAMATVDLVQPFFDANKNFLTVRVQTRNTANLRVGQLVNATISLGSHESLWLPNEAVIDLGTDKVVFVKDGAVLKPKKVMTGVVSKSEVEIKSGLVTSDEVAANAQFLSGSESFIKP